MYSGEKNIKVFVCDGLGYIAGEVVLNPDSTFDGISLKNPARLQLMQDGLSIQPLLVKEELVTLNASKVIAEINPDQKIIDAYNKFVVKFFSGIILPENSSIDGLKLV